MPRIDSVSSQESSFFVTAQTIAQHASDTVTLIEDRVRHVKAQPFGCETLHHADSCMATVGENSIQRASRRTLASC